MYLLQAEQSRIERSEECLLLMLLELESSPQSASLENLVAALSGIAAFKGWYKDGFIAGLIFSEIALAEAEAEAEVLLARVRAAASDVLGDLERDLRISVQMLRPARDKKSAGAFPGLRIVEEFSGGHTKFALFMKRCLDVAGSLFAITFFSPVFLAVALAVKLTSKGPILFRQKRVGQYGQTFEFLKFRSMKADNDPTIHEKFIKGVIAGGAGVQQKSGGQVYKLTNDPRITRVGQFIRKTSLDELPQFFNVLKGEMSLVGPRPPIPYEVEVYQPWHRRRLQVKPGITGLWQVSGRCNTSFEEMVRLDLQYARTWTVWMDVRILLATPKAMVSGEGAH